MSVRTALTDLPTRVHLWCAEHELRAARTNDPARTHNLDLLRDYRRRRRFPRHSGTRPASCFVDPDGRQCAVAHLMADAGETTAVRRIRDTQNYARLRAMDPAPLRDWQLRSGLAVADLARIQPTYAPRVDPTLSWLTWLQLMLLGPFVLASIVVNLVRLTRGRLRSVARTTGLVLGSVLLLGVAAIAIADLALSEHRVCDDGDDRGVPPPDGGIGHCGDSLIAPWPTAAVLAVLGVASLAAFWFNRRRGAVVDELLGE